MSETAMKSKKEILYDDLDFDRNLWVKSQIIIGQLYLARGLKISDETIKSLNLLQEFLQYQIDRKSKFVKQNPDRWELLFTES